jgi:hypothetical protein
MRRGEEEINWKIGRWKIGKFEDGSMRRWEDGKM